MPSPVRAQMGMIFMSGLRRRTYFLQDVGIEAQDVLFAGLQVEVEIGQHVDLVDEQHVADGEHQRVLEGLVVALGDGEDHGVFDRAGIELRGADEVADVFEDRKVDVLRAETDEALLRHARIEVAHAAGVQLDDLDSGLLDRGGIHVGVDVGLHDADAEFVLQRGDRRLQGGGFAGAGGAHQIQEEGLLPLELLAQLVGLPVVVFKNALLDFQYAIAFHGNTSVSKE